LALHDYRYLGEDFRERERIKRKKQRWTDRLERLPTRTVGMAAQQAVDEILARI
jgi:DNA adenine methylase